MGKYDKEIEEIKKKINNPILKTHVRARICTNESCSKYNQIQITDHYICPYCSLGLEPVND